jgi:hypothetical protein
VLAITNRSRLVAAGHPLWHLLVIAAAAVGVFGYIKVKEYFDHRRALRQTRGADRPHASAAWLPAPTAPIVVLAAASLLSGGIHASVSGEHFREAFIFGAFFTVAAAAQVAWGILLLHRPSRALLALEAIGNAAVIALWTITRTVGLPVGPEQWRSEAIGTLDVVSTLFEVVIVVMAVTLLVRNAPRRRGPAQRARVPLA